MAAWANSSTFSDDAEALDEFYGDGGLDWFLAKSGDSVRDAEPGEVTAGL